MVQLVEQLLIYLFLSDQEQAKTVPQNLQGINQWVFFTIGPTLIYKNG